MVQPHVLLAVIIAASLAAPAFAQSPTAAPPRRGGLLPQRPTAPAIGPQSREELMRRFDLNADGRVDDAEAEMARSRMRRERADIMTKSGIDPLTGRPRGEAPPVAKSQEPAALGATDARMPQAVPGDDELLLVPGRPDSTPPSTAPRATTQPPASAAQKSVPANQAPAQAPTAMTGGVRAGAPPARPGYGSLSPKPDLNAARQPTARAGSAASPSAAPSPSGAPSLRNRTAVRPGQPGQPASPAMGRQTTGRLPSTRPAPPTPRPGLFPQSGPRVSAEDLGQ